MEYPIYTNNSISFSNLVNNHFGRFVIETTEDDITSSNVADVLAAALATHAFNAIAEHYLDEYYRGNQPVLYRKKIVRPEINNKIVENHAFENVESKTANRVGELVVYALDGENDREKGRLIDDLNKKMRVIDKAAKDIERERWASICGTSYCQVIVKNRMPDSEDIAPFDIIVLDPTTTFVCYYSDDKTPAFAARELQNSNGERFWRVYTHREVYKIVNGEVVNTDINGYGFIPIIEYPNNERRLSDIEISIGVTDAINNLSSDRINGVEQFVNALMKFKNCEVDKDTFLEMCQLGAVKVQTTTQGYDADVDIMSAELDQSHAQTAKDDLYQNMLIIQGRPGRQENSGGDTGQAVVLRNGYYDEEERSELRVPLFVKCERMLLRVILNVIRIKSGGNYNLKLSDIEIRPKHSKLENMMVKAQVLQILHGLGVDDAEAIKLVNLFSDPTETYNKSRERMEKQFEHSIGEGKDNTVNIGGTDNSENVVAV